MAAEEAGVTVNTLVQAARRDGELRAALDGMPAAVQVAAQRAEFLSALVRCGGDLPRAEAQAGLRRGAVSEWRLRKPEFDAVVVAILAWLSAVDAVPRKPQTRMSKSDKARLCRMWQDGISTNRIATDLGVSRNTVVNWRRRLNLPARHDETVDRLPELSDRFRELWEGGASYAKIQAELNISNATIARWHKKLKLPGRRR